MSAVLAKPLVAFFDCQQHLLISHVQESLLCAHCHSARPWHGAAKAGWLLVIFYGVDMALACLICSSLCFGQQKSLFSIPAGTNVTVLVPSEEAINSLNKSEKDFWLTPSTLPVLVRYEEIPLFALVCQTTVTKLWVGFLVVHAQ